MNNLNVQISTSNIRRKPRSDGSQRASAIAQRSGPEPCFYPKSISQCSVVLFTTKLHWDQLQDKLTWYRQSTQDCGVLVKRKIVSNRCISKRLNLSEVVVSHLLVERGSEGTAITTLVERAASDDANSVSIRSVSWASALAVLSASYASHDNQRNSDWSAQGQCWMTHIDNRYCPRPLIWHLGFP